MKKLLLILSFAFASATFAEVPAPLYRWFRDRISNSNWVNTGTGGQSNWVQTVVANQPTVVSNAQLEFDNTDDWMTNNMADVAAALTNLISISFWFNADDIDSGGTAGLFGNYDFGPGGGRTGIVVDSNLDGQSTDKLGLRMTPDGASTFSIVGGSTFSNNVWYNYGFRFAATGAVLTNAIQIFVDGVEDPPYSCNNCTGSGPHIGLRDYFSLGVDNNQSFPYNGELADLQIWTQHLSNLQFGEIFTNGMNLNTNVPIKLKQVYISQ